MDYNTCDMAVRLILGGSMSMLHAGRYYIKASINYLAASYDIALGGQNDWLMVISYVNSAVLEIHIVVHCFSTAEQSCQSIT